MRTIANEVVASLRADDGPEMLVDIDIKAPNKTGCDDDKVRTVSENAKTAKFDHSGIERS